MKPFLTFMLEFLFLLKRPTFSHKLEVLYIWICTKEKMGNRRSAYSWIQSIPAKPLFWYDANVNRFTPNILSGVFITSYSLNRRIEYSYGFLICCPYNAGPPARPLLPSPCPCHSCLFPRVLCTTLLVCPQFCPVPHSLSSFNTHRSGPSLLWAPQPLRSPITTQCP